MALVALVPLVPFVAFSASWAYPGAETGSATCRSFHKKRAYFCGLQTGKRNWYSGPTAACKQGGGKRNWYTVQERAVARAQQAADDGEAALGALQEELAAGLGAPQYTVRADADATGLEIARTDGSPDAVHIRPHTLTDREVRSVHGGEESTLPVELYRPLDGTGCYGQPWPMPAKARDFLECTALPLHCLHTALASPQ